MKTFIYFKAMILMFVMFGFSSNIQAKNQPTEEKQLTLVCPANMQNLVASWAKMYQENEPQLTIQIKEWQNFNAATSLNQPNVLGIVSQEQMQTSDWEKSWNISLARKIVVPIGNNQNPYLETFNNTGLSQKQLVSIANTGKISKNDPSTGKCMVYMPKDPEIESSIANFLAVDTDALNCKKLLKASDVIKAVQNDKLAIGFVFLSDLESAEQLSLPTNISFLPLDKNNSGSLESAEKFYTDLNTFKRAVWVGKYPHSLVQATYAVSSEKNITKTQKDFVKWILTHGQNQLNTMGYTALVNAEIPYKLDKIYQNELLVEEELTGFSGFKAFAILLAVILLVGMLIDVFLFRRYRKAEKRLDSLSNPSIFNVETLKVPSGLFFDKTHTWTFMEQSGKVRIGLDDFIPSVTGELTGIVMKNQGELVKKGDVLFTIIRHGKQLDIQAPVSGKIFEHNQQLSKDASLVNASPYDKGWIYLIEPSNWLREIQFYLMADKFRLWLKAEYLRFKDFLAIVNKPSGEFQAQVIFQEGGEMNKGVLGEMEPAVWEEFQQHFIHVV
jgi:glycine cleavage system H lipoate-binding protein/ABC-type phosphate transport system substrate-binding protein